MSRENVEIVRMHLAAYMGADPGRAFEFLDPAVEFDTRSRPDGKVWSGHDGVRRAMTEWTGAWEDWELEIERLLDAGEDRVVYFWHERGRGRASGAPMEQSGATVVVLRDGRIVSFTAYIDPNEALEAVQAAP
jgi:ketosteroid isomerase-like protein